MPHGWAIAEIWLLMRDCLVHERGDHSVLFAGVPPTWFKHADGMNIAGLPTYFGSIDVRWIRSERGAELLIGASGRPPGEFLLRLPAELRGRVFVGGRLVEKDAHGDHHLDLPPERAAHVEIRFE